MNCHLSKFYRPVSSPLNLARAHTYTHNTYGNKGHLPARKKRMEEMSILSHKHKQKDSSFAQNLQKGGWGVNKSLHSPTHSIIVNSFTPLPLHARYRPFRAHVGVKFPGPAVLFTICLWQSHLVRILASGGKWQGAGWWNELHEPGIELSNRLQWKHASVCVCVRIVGIVFIFHY